MDLHRRGEWAYVYPTAVGSLAFGRDDDGDLFVNINTEDAVPGCNDEQGMPQVFVYLNDATLYEPRRPVTTQQAIEKIAAVIVAKETHRKRVILAIGDPDWIEPARGEDGRVINWDTFLLSDEKVLDAFAALGDDEYDNLYEQAKGDDYETLDALAGEMDGLGLALQILRGES